MVIWSLGNLNSHSQYLNVCNYGTGFFFVNRTHLQYNESELYLFNLIAYISATQQMIWLKYSWWIKVLVLIVKNSVRYVQPWFNNWSQIPVWQKKKIMKLKYPAKVQIIMVMSLLMILIILLKLYRIITVNPLILSLLIYFMHVWGDGVCCIGELRECVESGLMERKVNFWGGGFRG